MEIRPRSLLWGVALCLLVAPASADALQQQAEGQRTQAELESRIEAADDDVRERLEELRRLERETRQLSARSDELAPRLERQAEALDRREAALATLGETREALPDLQRRLVERLARWVDRDLPFLVEERRARAASLERSMGDPDASAAERLASVLAAWRTELDYGREFDAWRGTLEEGETRREVEFLRLGRIGLYYLTPDSRQGGVWRAEEGRWVALDEPARRQLRHGLHIARDRRAPELLHLPLSVSLAASSASDREVLP
ncbi:MULTISPECIES: DUF3450 domain-containing protein [Halomonas]|uniref:DUF3450 domain-containing protein n=1 Tax=Halomonas TaxID=2745 RepID=UPI0020B7E7F8|nr:DUF3450 domain-containing protein [Halomonas sp. 3H]